MILMNDFKGEPEELRTAEVEAAERVLRSGWYVLGNEVKEFEAAWAKQCGTDYAVGVANGMDAIEIGLRAMKIGPGDEIVTTPMTAFATVLAIFRAGATPVFADIDPETALLDLDSVRRCVSARTKAVILVHLYGQIGDMPRWQAFCSQKNLLLIEDCAQAHFARWRGKSAGAYGEFGAYSFYPTKNLGAKGDGGAIVTNNKDIAHHASMLRNYGQSQRYHHPKIGLNSRLDEIQAAFLVKRLAWLDQFTERRRFVAKCYLQGIRNSKVRLLAEPTYDENHVYHLFVLKCEERDRLSGYLSGNGIQNLSHYPIPLHRQAPCEGLRMDPMGLVVSEQHAATCLSIPCHPQLTDGEVERVIEVINAFH